MQPSWEVGPSRPYSRHVVDATLPAASYSQKLLMFDALEGMFRVIKLRPRQPHCAVCGDNPTITQLQDYELFCGSRADDKVLLL